MYERRVQQLSEILRNEGMDAFIAQTKYSLGYLAGFPEDSHERFMALVVNREGKSALICPALSATQASRAGIADIRPWRDGEDPLALFETLCDEWNLHSGIFAVDDLMPAKMVLEMQKTLPAALYKPGADIIGDLMRRKDSAELDLLRQAAKIADDTFESIQESLKIGMTELEIAELLNQTMIEKGGKPAFAIVALGSNSAEPHHLNDETRLENNQLVLMDFGCSVQGYYSDITRVVFVGEASSEHKAIYDVVYRAHMAGRQRGAVGVLPADIDAATRNVILDEGYGDFFTHRTGHGIGAQLHEIPYISSVNQDPIVAGDCFSIEPGIYLPGKFGVRIENIVVANENGLDSLNAEPSPVLLELRI